MTNPNDPADQHRLNAGPDYQRWSTADAPLPAAPPSAAPPQTGGGTAADEHEALAQAWKAGAAYGLGYPSCSPLAEERMKRDIAGLSALRAPAPPALAEGEKGTLARLFDAGYASACGIGEGTVEDDKRVAVDTAALALRAPAPPAVSRQAIAAVADRVWHRSLDADAAADAILALLPGQAQDSRLDHGARPEEPPTDFGHPQGAQGGPAASAPTSSVLEPSS